MKKMIKGIWILVAAAGCGCGDFDDSALRDRIDSYKNRIEVLQEKAAGLQTQLNDLSQLTNGNVITSVSQDSDGKFIVTYKDDSDQEYSVVLATMDEMLDIPVLGVALDEEEGVYYWTQTVDGETSWLLKGENGERIPVRGNTPALSVDDEGYWTVNGERLVDAAGNPIGAEDGSSSIFREASYEEGIFSLTLGNGEKLTLRYDGSSNLSRDNRWFLFPSVMVAWNLNREPFFQVKQIDLLKLRLSYGIMGSESVDPYSYQMTYNALDQNYTFGGTPAAGYAVEELTDRLLGWEKTRSYNAGLDLAAFNNRLNFEADFFRKETFDIIMTRSIPSHVGGLSGPKSNVGTVLNKGFEISGSWRDRIKDFSYGVNLSVGFVRNRVLSLDGGQILANSNTLITKEGYPIRSISMKPTVTTSRRRRSTTPRWFTATARNCVPVI